MKTTLAMTLLAVVAAPANGCSASVRETEPVVTLAPDEFVLRDVRKDAARYLNCQVPNVRVEAGPWAGSQGNVIAIGCGFQITYYVRCRTNHQCEFTVTD